MQWYYQKDGADEGPFEAERMRELIASGSVAPETLIRRDDTAWLPAGESEFAECFGGAALAHFRAQRDGDGGLGPFFLWLVTGLLFSICVAPIVLPFLDGEILLLFGPLAFAGIVNLPLETVTSALSASFTTNEAFS